jgi:hypothetical protein
MLARFLQQWHRTIHERPPHKTPNRQQQERKKQSNPLRPEQDQNQNSMQSALNFLMLACASLAALAFGVLLAYGVCRVAFGAMRMHVRSIALASQPQSQADSQIEAQTASL